MSEPKPGEIRAVREAWNNNEPQALGEHTPLMRFSKTSGDASAVGWPVAEGGRRSRRGESLRAGLLAIALLAVLGSLSAQTPEQPSADPIAIDVMTFNIRTSLGRDGENVWPNRKELVAETIERFNPDIVGLQEALSEQIDFLETALPQYRWVGVDRGLNGGIGLSEATPIFYRYEELVPIESGTFWLSDDPNLPSDRRRVSRIVTWARFHHLATRQQIYAFNTHFTLRRGQRQVESAKRINERVGALPPGSAVIVMGDFNAVAGSSTTWEVATSQGLRDAWLIARERRGPPLTANGFGPPPEGREGRIDWVLVSDPIEVLAVATIVDSADGRYPSDHYPVLAKLLVPPG